MEEEIPEVTVNLVLRPYDSEVVLRQVVLGMHPIVLIEGEKDDDGVIFNIDATGLDQGELGNLLELLTEAVRNGEVV